MNTFRAVLFISGFLYSLSQEESIWLTGTSIPSDKSALINVNVIITLDISSHIVKKFHEITLYNYGNLSVKHFAIAIEPNLSERLSYIEVSDEFHNTVFVKVTDDENFGHFYIASLNQPLKRNETKIFFVNTLYTNLLESYPKVVRQYQTHLVNFVGNILFYSPYFTLDQSIHILKGNGRIEEIEGTDCVLIGQYLECKNSTLISPYSENIVRIHYENLDHFLSVTNLKRNIYVSQWGFIQVNQEFNITHTGATFVGPFHRNYKEVLTDTQQSHFIVRLPKTAYNIFLSDEIGTIWSYEIQEKNNPSPHLEMIIKNRFVLYGGWKTSFKLSYRVSTKHFIYRNGEHLFLKMNILETYLHNMVIEEAIVNVILPEGAKLSKLELPYSAEIIDYEENVFSYLDVIGRKIVGFKKTNLVQEHTKAFTVQFLFQMNT